MIRTTIISRFKVDILTFVCTMYPTEQLHLGQDMARPLNYPVENLKKILSGSPLRSLNN